MFWIPRELFAPEGPRWGWGAHTHGLFWRYCCSAFSTAFSIKLGLETSCGTVTVIGKELKSFTATLVRPDGMLGLEHSLGRRKGNKGVGKTVNPDSAGN